MSVTDVLVIIALVFATIDEVQAKGRALTTWAVIFVCAALLYHLVG
jgi:drug/metabolite transporter superfamily protein YnfA